MVKLNVLVIDWYKKLDYRQIKELVDLTFTQEEFPKSLEGMSAVSIHNPDSSKQVDYLMKKTEDSRIPIILQGGFQQEGSKHLFKKYERVHVLDTYEDLYNFIRDRVVNTTPCIR